MTPTLNRLWLAILVTVLAGCGPSSDRAAEVHAAKTTVPATSEEDSPANPSMPLGLITAGDIKAEWPFRVPAVRLNCTDGLAMVLVAEGSAYLLFGRRESATEYYGEGRVNEALLSPRRPGGYPGLGDLFDLGKTRCRAAGLWKHSN